MNHFADMELTMAARPTYQLVRLGSKMHLNTIEGLIKERVMLPIWNRKITSDQVIKVS
jgi:hypothetical protein